MGRSCVSVLPQPSREQRATKRHSRCTRVWRTRRTAWPLALGRGCVFGSSAAAPPRGEKGTAAREARSDRPPRRRGALAGGVEEHERRLPGPVARAREAGGRAVTVCRRRQRRLAEFRLVRHHFQVVSLQILVGNMLRGHLNWNCSATEIQVINQRDQHICATLRSTISSKQREVENQCG